ncbi:hypothetical protein C2845_PM11G03680 [Panicum miliaceum]|uniref:4-hydroxy-tetrahydrodipicolinate reductase n=1 Tax=Panicum miliaceum TaxID=4540 RepID=A0A3L6RTK4_PANMI|nr:hypothetical protein C2845_PM11G03680 [Panicum miliaceum]
MLSATIAAHPAAAAATTLRQRQSIRPRQPLRVPIGAAAPRRRMATARPSVVKALASQGVPAVPPKLSFPILVNSCTGKMGKAVAEAAVSAGLQLVPVSFSAMEVPDGKLEICDREIRIHDPSESEKILPSIIEEYPDLIVVDYTVPDAVNANAELYCKLGLPFVMGTTGGNRQLLHKTMQDGNIYAVISPQMGKQVVAFLAAMEIMAEQFPGAFSGYKLELNQTPRSAASSPAVADEGRSGSSTIEKQPLSTLKAIIQIEMPGDAGVEPKLVSCGTSFAFVCMKLGPLADGGVRRLLLFFTMGRFSQGLPVLDWKTFRMADTFTTQERGRVRKKKTEMKQNVQVNVLKEPSSKCSGKATKGKKTIEVMESHQATKLDVSGTAKAVISCFQKLGVSFDMDEVKLVRDPEEQVNVVGVPEEHLAGHAFHMYHLTSPDGTVSFEFQHNVCGRSIYAEGTVDAAMFLYTKIQSGASKKLYDMIDVLREGNMR